MYMGAWLPAMLLPCCCSPAPSPTFRPSPQVLLLQVGYSIRIEDCTSIATNIKHMTDGMQM
jgi:hypothetical protein